MHATEARKIMVQSKDLFSAGNNAPSPLLINLTKSIFFLLFLPKYTEWILGKKKKKNPLMLVCGFITGFSTLFLNQFVTDFASKKKRAFVIPHFVCILLPPLERSWSLAKRSEYQIKLYPFISVPLQPVQRCCEKESELKSSVLRKDGQWSQAQKHLKNSSLCFHQQ